MEQETTPSPCHTSSRCLLGLGQEQQGKGNMLKEFERIGAEAQLSLLSTPGVVVPSGGKQENQLARVGEGEEWRHGDTLSTDCTARGRETTSTRRQSGGGPVGATTPTILPAWCGGTILPRFIQASVKK